MATQLLLGVGRLQTTGGRERGFLQIAVMCSMCHRAGLAVTGNALALRVGTGLAGRYSAVGDGVWGRSAPQSVPAWAGGGIWDKGSRSSGGVGCLRDRKRAISLFLSLCS